MIVVAFCFTEVRGMEHINLINRIIEAEQKAQEMADAAKAKRQSLQSDLKGATDEIRKTYFERASRRIEDVRGNEERHADEMSAQLDERYLQELSHMESMFSEHRTEWVNKLFSLIVGR